MPTLAGNIMNDIYENDYNIRNNCGTYCIAVCTIAIILSIISYKITTNIIITLSPLAVSIGSLLFIKTFKGNGLALSLILIYLFASMISAGSLLFWIKKPLYPTYIKSTWNNALTGLLGVISIFIIGYLLIISMNLESKLNPYIKLSASFASGYAVIASVQVLLIATRLLSRTYSLTLILLIILLLFIININKIKNKFTSTRGKSLSWLKRADVFLVILLALWGVGFYQAIAYPLVEWDSLAYGINYALLIYRSGGDPRIFGPSIGIEMSSSYPVGLQGVALYLMYASGGFSDVYYRLLVSLSSLMLTLGLYGFLSYLRLPLFYERLVTLSLAAGGLYYFYGSEASYIGPLSLLILITLVLLEIQGEGNGGLLAGIVTAGAITTSYLGLTTVLIILVYFALRPKKSRIAMVLLVATALSATWYIRNLIVTGNPFYPMLGFGGHLVHNLYQSTQLHFESYKKLYLRYLLSPHVFYIPDSFYVLINIVPIFLILYKIKNNKDIGALETSTLVSPILLITISIIHVAFIRFFYLYTPISLISLALLLKEIDSKSLETMRGIFFYAVIILVIAGLTYGIHIKTPSEHVSDQWSYLDWYYPDVSGSWKWLSNHQEGLVGTYDIREYYINLYSQEYVRRVILLDGYKASIAYNTPNEEKSLYVLRQLGISYVLTTPATTPGDHRCPKAYYELPAMKLLGTKAPLVFIDKKGGALYSLIGNTSVNFTLPRPVFRSTTTISGSTWPPSSQILLAIPCDLRGGDLVVVSKSSQPISVELFQGWIPLNETTGWWKHYKMIIRSPSLTLRLGEISPAFRWHINKCGRFTLKVVGWSTSSVNSTVNLLLAAVSVLDVSDMHLPLNGTVVAMFDNSKMPPAVFYYLKINETTNISLSAYSQNNYISLEIFNGTIPFGLDTSWWSLYTMLYRDPPLNYTKLGSWEEASLNVTLKPGLYTIVVPKWSDSWNNIVTIKSIIIRKS